MAVHVVLVTDGLMSKEKDEQEQAVSLVVVAPFLTNLFDII
jgi:hypothetical protein